jgi:hypothetical protein
MPSAGRSAASTTLTAALRSGTTVHGKNSSTARSPYCEAKSLIAASRSVNRLKSGSYADVIMYRAPSSAPAAAKGSSDETSISGVILTNSISSTATPVAAIAALVARINGLSSING